MKKITIISLFLLQSGFIFAGAILDLEKTTNYVAIFDAGLRPWRSTNSSLLIKDIENLGVKIPGHGVFYVNASYGTMSVREGGEISSIKLWGDTMDIVRIKTELKRLAFEVGLNSDSMIKNIEDRETRTWRNRKNEDGEMYWLRTKPVDNIQVHIGFQPLLLTQEVKGRIGVTISVRSPGGMGLPYHGSLPPPAGYEHLSLDWPKDRNKNKKPCITEADIVLSEKLAKAMNYLITTDDKLREKMQEMVESHDPVLVEKKKQERAARLSWWIAGGVALSAALAAGIFYWRHRRGAAPGR